jgi:hypothetical protein
MRRLPIQKPTLLAKRQFRICRSYWSNHASNYCNVMTGAPSAALKRLWMMTQTDDPTTPKRRRIEMFGRGFDLPQGRWARIGLGSALIFFGFLGFLPILGFWMIPLGLFVLSLEFSAIRRLRRRLVVRFSKRNKTPR